MKLIMLYVNYSGSVGKESACDAGDAGRWEFEPQVRKILCRRARKPTPVFSPGEPHRQRSLENYITVHGLQRVGCNGTCTFSPRLPPCSIHSTLMSSLVWTQKTALEKHRCDRLAVHTDSTSIHR